MYSCTRSVCTVGTSNNNITNRNTVCVFERKENTVC